MKFLVAHNGSAHADNALGEASRMAVQMGTEVAIMTVSPDLCLTEASNSKCKLITGSLLSEVEDAMKQVVAELAAKGIKAEIVFKDGHPVEMIIDTAKEIGVDLIVSTRTEGTALKGFFLAAYQQKL